MKGQYPMRYAGGLLGGSWLTAMTGDLGAGTFDGAWPVQNFENQNPANTLWTKQYNLWSEIDTEVDRYLGFEKWWGGHITLNADEMQWIVDELFVGNRLAGGGIRTSDGTAIDLRNIRSPIVVFCSKGDNVTPPQQALDWILDLYDTDDEIRTYGQTIVYTIHHRIGHLGILVSAGVARKEHDEFASYIDFIDVLPPGLYEAVLEPRGEAVENPDLVTGEWVMRCEPRRLDDIRAVGGNDLEDERRFEAAARLSDINLSLYRAFAQPWIRAVATPAVAETLQKIQPLRLSYEMFGSGNPFLGWVAGAAERVRSDRRPATGDNPFLVAQEHMSRQIVEGLETWRKMAEAASEQAFHAIYGSPALQAALGIDPASDRPPRKVGKSLLHAALVERRIAELREAMDEGGMRGAVLRALVYVGMARSGPDERAFEALRRVRRHHEAMPLTEFKALLRQQYFMVMIDEDAALAAIPGLLPDSAEDRRAAFGILEEVLTAAGPLPEAAAERLARIARLFDLDKSPDRRGAVEAPANTGVHRLGPRARSAVTRGRG